MKENIEKGKKIEEKKHMGVVNSKFRWTFILACKKKNNSQRHKA